MPKGTSVTISSLGSQPSSRVAENPYASISQRKNAASSSRSDNPKGYRHRPTAQIFDADVHRLSTELPSLPAGSSSPTSSSSLDCSLTVEDDGGPTPPTPPILIVGTKEDLRPKAATAPGPGGSWRHDLTHLGTLLLQGAARVMQRVLFLPVPMRKLLHIDGTPLNGDKAGNGHPTKAPDFLNFLRQEWNATVLEVSCHSVQEDRLHKVELFTDRVMDTVFSVTCKV
eukprot:EG_transcript_18582